jgi:hypothetical protein
VKKTTGPYPALTVDGAGSSVVPHAGARLLLSTAQTVGLTAALSAALAPWRRPLAGHDPGKIVTELAVSLAIGGDCLAGLAQLRASPKVFGSVAPDPTVSRLVDALAADAPAALAAINTAHARRRSGYPRMETGDGRPAHRLPQPPRPLHPVKINYGSYADNLTGSRRWVPTPSLGTLTPSHHAEAAPPDDSAEPRPRHRA